MSGKKKFSDEALEAFDKHCTAYRQTLEQSCIAASDKRRSDLVNREEVMEALYKYKSKKSTMDLAAVFCGYLGGAFLGVFVKNIFDSPDPYSRGDVIGLCLLLMLAVAMILFNFLRLHR